MVLAIWKNWEAMTVEAILVALIAIVIVFSALVIIIFCHMGNAKGHGKN